uniref:Uncharacterized protein n=1 Tax=Arundo donax TaxID=35708 RepID=A0A0A9AMT9_ARUDO
MTSPAFSNSIMQHAYATIALLLFPYSGRFFTYLHSEYVVETISNFLPSEATDSFRLM